MIDISSSLGFVEQSLKDLGSSNQEIYNNLKSKRIYGEQCNACLCPIANYLNSLTNKKVLVGPFTANIGGTEIDLPETISDFIEDFDTDVDGIYQAIRT